MTSGHTTQENSSTVIKTTLSKKSVAYRSKNCITLSGPHCMELIFQGSIEMVKVPTDVLYFFGYRYDFKWQFLKPITCPQRIHQVIQFAVTQSLLQYFPFSALFIYEVQSMILCLYLGQWQKMFHILTQFHSPTLDCGSKCTDITLLSPTMEAKSVLTVILYRLQGFKASSYSSCQRAAGCNQR